MTAQERRNHQQTVYRRKHRAEIRWNAMMIRRYGKKWWLRLAWIKAGGNPLDWPIKKPKYY